MLFLLLSLISSITWAKEPFKVAIIDTGLNLSDTRFHHLCSSGHIDLTNTSLKDSHGHGTHIASLVEKYAGDENYCLMIIKTFHDDSKSVPYGLGMEIAIKNGASIINISGGGMEPDINEFRIIRSHPEVNFIVAAGNNDTNLDTFPTFFPAAYGTSNITAVGSRGFMGRKSYFSNYGSMVKAWEDGEQAEGFAVGGGFVKFSGTSQATAIRTGKVIRRWLSK